MHCIQLPDFRYTGRQGNIYMHYAQSKKDFAQMLINAATLPDVDKIVQSAQKATEESKNQTKEAQILAETIKKQTNHISFSINSEDGGLDIVYTE